MSTLEYPARCPGSATRKDSDLGRRHDRQPTLDGTVTTPDEIATARLRGKSSITVSLVPGYFTTTTPARLGDKLAELGELLWQARQDVFRRTHSEPAEQVSEAVAYTPRGATFRRAPDSVVCVGHSVDGSVRVCTVGMTTWMVELEPPAFTRGEEAFCEAAGQALSGVVADRLSQLHRMAALARAGRERNALVGAGQGPHA